MKRQLAKDPRRHHQVPRWYLDRFARNEQVLVRTREGREFVTSTKNVAVETGFYDFTLPDGERTSVVERILSWVDGEAAEAAAAIDRTGRPPTAGSREREILAGYLALQTTRTADQRERVLFPEHVAAFAAGRPITRDLVADYLERNYLGFAPDPNEVGGAHTFVTAFLRDGPESLKNLAIDNMLNTVAMITPRLEAMHWSIELGGRWSFVTSDVPVVVWRKPSARDELRGFGIADASEVRFPLDPEKQLVLSERPRSATIRVAAHRPRRCNADLANGCHRQLIAHPDQHDALRRTTLDTYSPRIRFSVGRGVRQFADGREEPMAGEILQMRVERRPSVEDRQARLTGKAAPQRRPVRFVLDGDAPEDDFDF